MSLLSQFFPGGSGLKVEFVLVGGGGGGGARGAAASPTLIKSNFAGGGGGGQVVVGEDYPVVPGISYAITIGAGGAGGCLLPSPYVAPVPVQPYCNLLISGQPGRSGGTSCFGSVFARGGGGGSGGLYPTCIPIYTPTNPGLQQCGCPGGSGGGSGALACFPWDNSGPYGSFKPGGRALGNYSIGNTIKFGGDGQNSIAPSATAPMSNPVGPYNLTVWYTCTQNFAGGGGGAGTGAGGFSGGIVTLSGANPSFLPGAPVGNPCLGTMIYAAYSGPLSSGGAGIRPGSATLRNVPILDHVHGIDGYLTSITGTDEYFGGGGEAFQGQSMNSCDYTALSPTHPCYPVHPSLFNKCPAGGAGGGAYRLRCCGGTPSLSSPGTNILVCCSFNAPNSNAVFPVGANACYVLCGATPGTGGGGASSPRGYANTTTGPCAANPAVADGTNGAGGVLIIRYPSSCSAATVTGNTPITPVPGYHIYKWTGPGTITFN